MHQDWSTEQVLSLSVKLQALSGEMALAAHRIGHLEEVAADQHGQIDRLATEVHDARVTLGQLERSLRARRSAGTPLRDPHMLGSLASLLTALALLAAVLLGHSPEVEAIAGVMPK